MPVSTDATQLSLSLPVTQPGRRGLPSLADRLCDFLVRWGRPMGIGDVVSEILQVRGCPPALERTLVADIVDGDPRLVWCGRAHVGLTPSRWSAARIDEVAYCIVDLETTGGVPGRSKITEIGAVRLRAGRIVDRFSTLVDPRHEIPPVIQKITGIEPSMLVGQPTIDETIDAFATFVGDDVMVAHNAAFDLSFLNYERYRVSGRYFTQPWLDTLVLARRLLHQRVERFNLRALAEWAGSPVNPVHRALADAEATAAVLVRLLDLLVETGVTSLERALEIGRGGGVSGRAGDAGNDPLRSARRPPSASATGEAAPA